MLGDTKLANNFFHLFYHLYGDGVLMDCCHKLSGLSRHIAALKLTSLQIKSNWIFILTFEHYYSFYIGMPKKVETKVKIWLKQKNLSNSHFPKFWLDITFPSPFLAYTINIVQWYQIINQRNKMLYNKKKLKNVVFLVQMFSRNLQPHPACLLVPHHPRSQTVADQ